MTGLSIIKAAMRKARILATGEDPSGSETVDALETLNNMLERWSVDLGGLFFETQETFTLTASTATYTLGAGGDFDTVRPMQILNLSVRDSTDLDFPVLVVTNHEYERIINKTPGNARPYIAKYNPSNPLGSLTLYPPPDQAYTVRIASKKPLLSVGINSAYAIPPGYNEAIINNLAYILSAGEYGLGNSAALKNMADEGYTILKRDNFQIESLIYDQNLPGLGRLNGSSSFGGGFSFVVAPESLIYSNPAATYTYTVPITPNTPIYTGGVPTNYSISPTIPGGLTLNATTGIITGTPTQTNALATYTITAGNSAGSVSTTITIFIQAPD